MSTHVDDGLERRLRALAETGTPDWRDVVTRRPKPARRPRRRLLIAALAGAAVLLAAAAAAGVGSRVLDLLSLSESDQEVPTRAPVAYVSGDRLFVPGRTPIQLATPLLAPLMGNYVPLAFSSPDGRSVVYHGWEHGKPQRWDPKQAQLRIVDTRSGIDRLLARGAQSFAWADRLAFVVGRRVIVRERPFGPGTVWTPNTASYRVAAWAGDRLLVEVARCLLMQCVGDP
jgi:hypothetical protein